MLKLLKMIAKKVVYLGRHLWQQLISFRIRSSSKFGNWIISSFYILIFQIIFAFYWQMVLEAFLDLTHYFHKILKCINFHIMIFEFDSLRNNYFSVYGLLLVRYFIWCLINKCTLLVEEQISSNVQSIFLSKTFFRLFVIHSRSNCIARWSIFIQ